MTSDTCARPDLSRPATLTLFLLILLAALGLRVTFANGWAASDDRLYHAVATRLLSSGSAQLGEGDILYDNRAARVSFILAATGWIKVFGDSESAMAALDILFGVLEVAALYWVARAMASRKAALAAAALLAVYPPSLIYNGFLFPDHFGQLWMLVTIGAYLRAVRGRGGGRGRAWWIGAGAVAMALAVSAKETAVVLGVVLPLLGVLARRRNRVFIGLLIAALAVVLFLAMELPALSWMHGDALYRFRAAEVSFGEGGISRQLFNVRRMLYYPSLLLVRQDLVGVFGWGLAAAAAWALRRRRRFAPVVAWTVAAWLFLEFGSSTMAQYSPLPKEGRLMAPITMLLFIPLGDLAVRSLAAMGGARFVAALAAVGVLVNGVFTANQQSRPLYWSDHKLALRAAVALHVAGGCPPLIVPSGVADLAAPREAARFRELPTIDLVGADREPVAPERMLFPAKGMGLVVPSSRFSWMLKHREHRAVRPEAYEEYLTRHARAIPLYAGLAPLERLLGIPESRRMSPEQVVGHVYVLPD